jgi:amino acid transporter
MAETAAGVAGRAPERDTGLEPNAIGVVQDTVIGMASSAPAATVGLTLASLAAATAYGSGPILILTAIPMLIIANAYRRLNMWNAHSGASFEWVGRAISPYLGFLTGWLMVVAYIIGTVSAVEVLGPSLITVFGGSGTPGTDFAIAAAVGLVMLVIAIVGIKITARAQIVMGVTEWAILLGFAVAGLVVVLSHRHGTFPATSGWLSPSGIGGHGDAVGGFLAAVFVYGGWDGTLYVNEEVTRRHINPGRAALLAVGLLTVLYVGCQIGLQGVVSPAELQANSDSALVYVAHVLGGSGWAKVMALAIALSVVATTGTGIVLSARIVYGVLPLAAAGFLGWVLVLSLKDAPASQAESVAGIVLLGVVLMLVARFWLRSEFFSVRRESYQPEAAGTVAQ